MPDDRFEIKFGEVLNATAIVSAITASRWGRGPAEFHGTQISDGEWANIGNDASCVQEMLEHWLRQQKTAGIQLHWDNGPIAVTMIFRLNEILLAPLFYRQMIRQSSKDLTDVSWYLQSIEPMLGQLPMYTEIAWMTGD